MALVSGLKALTDRLYNENQVKKLKTTHLARHKCGVYLKYVRHPLAAAFPIVS